MKAGKTEKEVLIQPPAPVFTMDARWMEGMVVMVPVCLGHLNYKEQSILTP